MGETFFSLIRHYIILPVDTKYAKNGTGFRLECKYEVPFDEKHPTLKPRWRVPQHISDTARLTTFGPNKTIHDNVIQWTNEILVTAAEVDDSGLYLCELYMGDVSDLSATDDPSWIYGNYSIPKDRIVRSVQVSVYGTNCSIAEYCFLQITS